MRGESGEVRYVKMSWTGFHGRAYSDEEHGYVLCVGGSIDMCSRIIERLPHDGLQITERHDEGFVDL